VTQGQFVVTIVTAGLFGFAIGWAWSKPHSARFVEKMIEKCLEDFRRRDARVG